MTRQSENAIRLTGALFAMLSSVKGMTVSLPEGNPGNQLELTYDPFEGERFLITAEQVEPPDAKG